MGEYILTNEHKKMLGRELKPCPFCGSDHAEITQNPMGKSAVFCRGCGTQTKAFDSSVDPINLWNTRK